MHSRLKALLPPCLGVMLSFGSSVAQSAATTQPAPKPPVAAQSIDSALAAKAGSGDVAAMLQMGRAYFTGDGAPLDLEKAHAWLLRAADQGSFEAQVVLGTAHMTGTKFAKDDALAAKYLQLAVEQINLDASQDRARAIAQYYLASLYEQGRGVEKSHENAIQYLKLAAANGNPGAEFDLGVLYSDGHRGLPADKAQACQLFVKAADGGHIRAMHNAAYCYQSGTGVAKDLNAAVKYYTQAAEAGSARSQYNLAMAYGELGQPDKAYFWMRIAQARGFEEKAGMVDSAKSQLSSTQVDEQEKQVTAWLTAHPLKQTAAAQPK
jgi:TPR repeat protein